MFLAAFRRSVGTGWSAHFFGQGRKNKPLNAYLWIAPEKILINSETGITENKVEK